MTTLTFPPGDDQIKNVGPSAEVPEESYLIEAMSHEWEEIVTRLDGTIEHRRLRLRRSTVKHGVKLVLVVGLLLGLMWKPDLLAPIAREVFRILSRSG